MGLRVRAEILLLCVLLCKLNTLLGDSVSHGSHHNHVFFKCLFEVKSMPVSLADLTVRWHHEERTLLEYRAETLMVYDQRAALSIDELKKGNASMTLSNLTLKDSGNYTCELQYDKDIKDVHYNLILEAQKSSSPSRNADFLFVVGKEFQKVKRGSNVSLPCLFTVDSGVQLGLLTVQWMKDGKLKMFQNKSHNYPPNFHMSEGKLQHGNASLELRNVSKKDSGKYECYIQHGLLKKSRFTTLIVQGGSVPIHSARRSPDPYRPVKIGLVLAVIGTACSLTFLLFFCYMP